MSIKLNDIPLDLLLKYFNNNENINNEYKPEMIHITRKSSSGYPLLNIEEYENNTNSFKKYFIKYSSLFSTSKSSKLCYYMPLIEENENNINIISEILKNLKDENIETDISTDSRLLNYEKVMVYDDVIYLKFFLNKKGHLVCEKYDTTDNLESLTKITTNYFIDYLNCLYLDYTNNCIILKIEGNPYKVQKRDLKRRTSI